MSESIVKLRWFMKTSVDEGLKWTDDYVQHQDGYHDRDKYLCRVELSGKDNIMQSTLGPKK